MRSFDFDPDSVAAAAELRSQHAPHSDWVVEQGSILDEQYLAGLGYFDIVYSWGVLHHTGNLWRAVDRPPGWSLLAACSSSLSTMIRVSRADNGAG